MRIADPPPTFRRHSADLAISHDISTFAPVVKYLFVLHLYFLMVQAGRREAPCLFRKSSSQNIVHYYELVLQKRKCTLVAHAHPAGAAGHRHFLHEQLAD